MARWRAPRRRPRPPRGMAAVNAALTCQLRAGCRVVASRAPVRLLPLHPDRDPAPLRRAGRSLSTAPTSTPWRDALAEPTDVVFFETPGNPTLELVDIAAVADLAHKARRARRGRQRHRDPDPATAARSSAPTSSSTRRPSTSTARAAASAASSSLRREFKREKLVPPSSRTQGPSLQPLQRLGAAQRPRDPAAARCAPTSRTPRRWPATWPTTRASRACSTRACPATRSTSWRGGR